MDKPRKIMQSFRNTLQYPQNISTPPQRCCYGNMTLGRRTMSNQRWNNIVHVNVEIYNVESTLSISKLILTLDNIETMLLFSTSSFTMLINSKTRLWIFLKIWNKRKNIFEFQKKDDSLINNTCFRLQSIKKNVVSFSAVSCLNLF